MTVREDPAVLRFVQTATTFCDLLESDALSHEPWAQATLTALAELYAATHRLPEPAAAAESYDGRLEDPAAEPAAGRFAVSVEEWRRVYARVTEMLGSDYRYWAYFDPSEPADKNELVLGDIADDLAEIYSEIAPGLRAWAAGGDPGAILWDWRGIAFATHWGRHAANALRALHSLVLDHGVSNE